MTTPTAEELRTEFEEKFNQSYAIETSGYVFNVSYVEWLEEKFSERKSTARRLSELKEEVGDWEGSYVEGINGKKEMLKKDDVLQLIEEVRDE